jgi:hypothetical protein
MEFMDYFELDFHTACYPCLHIFKGPQLVINVLYFPSYWLLRSIPCKSHTLNQWKDILLWVLAPSSHRYHLVFDYLLQHLIKYELFRSKWNCNNYIVPKPIIVLNLTDDNDHLESGMMQFVNSCNLTLLISTAVLNACIYLDGMQLVQLHCWCYIRSQRVDVARSSK